MFQMASAGSPPFLHVPYESFGGLALILQYEIAGSARVQRKNQLSTSASWVLLALHFPAGDPGWNELD